MNNVPFFASLSQSLARRVKKPPEGAPASALCPPAARHQLADQLRPLLPEQASILILSDDRGELAYDLAPDCRMVFSAGPQGGEAEPRRFWPDNVIGSACDLTKLWMADDSLHAAVLLNALQQCVDPGAALSELQRVLKPGGVLSVALTVRTERLTPEEWQQTMAMLHITDRFCWTAEEAETVLRQNGWEILQRHTLPAGLPMEHWICRSAADR